MPQLGNASPLTLGRVWNEGPSVSLWRRMPYETAYLRSRAVVARALAGQARDVEVARLLVQISEEFEEDALLGELSLLDDEKSSYVPNG